MNKKELGQHWLRDSEILTQIVKSAKVSSGDTVLEIGPGEGTLTEKLLETGASVHAVEFDQDLVPKLQKKLANCEKFAISEGDIRTFDLSVLPPEYKIVANIPYYLTSNLIRKLSEADNKPDVAVLLVQKEVAERICAEPGQMSVLACVAQYWFECSLGVLVPAQYFTPPPKVDSQVVIMQRRATPLISTPFDIFTDVVSTAFSQKRKKLANSLQKSSHLSKDQVTALLASAQVDGNMRAQQLTFEDWERLCTSFSELRKPTAK